MKCTECNTEYNTKMNAAHCPPIEERVGPRVTEADHPANSGTWARIVALPPVQRGPFYGAPPKD